MRAGSLRHYGRVERDTPTQDVDGHETAAWALVANAYMEIEPRGGREFWAGMGVVQEQGVPIRMRYDSRFAAMEPDKWRIVHGGVTYDITNVVNVGLRNVEFMLMTKTGSAVPNV